MGAGERQPVLFPRATSPSPPARKRSGSRAPQSATRSIAALATGLASEEPAAARPTRAEGPAPKPPFAYALPAAAPVTEGLGSVNASGMRSRGLTLAMVGGATLTAPADGTVRFSGPFRDFDGVSSSTTAGVGSACWSMSRRTPEAGR